MNKLQSEQHKSNESTVMLKMLNRDDTEMDQRANACVASRLKSVSDVVEANPGFSFFGLQFMLEINEFDYDEVPIIICALPSCGVSTYFSGKICI